MLSRNIYTQVLGCASAVQRVLFLAGRNIGRGSARGESRRTTAHDRVGIDFGSGSQTRALRALRRLQSCISSRWQTQRHEHGLLGCRGWTEELSDAVQVQEEAGFPRDHAEFFDRCAFEIVLVLYTGEESVLYGFRETDLDESYIFENYMISGS